MGNHARTRQLSIGRLLAVGIVAGALLPACALLDLDIEAPADYPAVHTRWVAAPARGPCLRC